MKLENIITLMMTDNEKIKQTIIQIKNLTIAHNYSVKLTDKVYIKCIKHLTIKLFSFYCFLKRKIIYSEKCKYCIFINFKYILVNSLLLFNITVFNNADRFTTYKMLII